LKEVISGEVDVRTRNKILGEVKIKIQQNLLDKAELLLSILETYFPLDIFIFYHAVKSPLSDKIGIGLNTFLFQTSRFGRKVTLIVR
jgi:hypothetical protein